MIKYEPIKSSFYKTNKKYCEEIERQLKTINIDSTGWCNCYGYEIDALLIKNHITYHIKYHKHQTTQNGHIPGRGFLDAIDYAGVELTVTGIDEKYSMTVGRSLFRRFFCSVATKEAIPKPYFINSNNQTNKISIYQLLERLRSNYISTIRLRKGTLICNIHVPTAEPIKLISDIEEIIKDWASERNGYLR